MSAINAVEILNGLVNLDDNKPTNDYILTSFFELSGIIDAAQIDLKFRFKFLKYIKMYKLTLEDEIACIKEFDQRKVNSIKKSTFNNYSNGFKNYINNNEHIFLLYVKNYEIAHIFLKTRKKEELIWDFRTRKPELTCQIKFLLCEILSLKKDYKIIRHLLVSLKLLYNFCEKNEISNIMLFEKSDKERFNAFVNQKLNITKIIDFSRKRLFLNNEEAIYWEANIWYMERFKLSDNRINKSCPILSLSFCDVNDLENRKALQIYTKYLIGISNSSLETIRASHHVLKNFLIFLEKNKLDLNELNDSIFNRYFFSIEGNKEMTRFKYICVIARFLKYLKVKKIYKLDGYTPYKSINRYDYNHINRSISEEKIMHIFENLDKLPADLRLMFLIIFCTGIRKSEVCMLKASSFSVNTEKPLIYVYQTKMKRDKAILIPDRLFTEIRDYVEKNMISNDQYIFRNANGDAYNSNTFTVKMKKEFKRIGIKDENYIFRAHDYRHTLATSMLKSGVQRSVIKQYLDHTDTRMTDKYLDNKHEFLLKEQVAFFNQNKIGDENE